MPRLDGLCHLSHTDAVLYLLAVILYPRDRAEQARLFARLQNSHTSFTIKRGLRPAAWRVDQAARQLTGLNKRDSDRTIGANAAAIMLWRALVEGKSLNSTCQALREHHGIATSTCWHYWDQFRPAAHLNAARCFWPGLWHPERPELKCLLSNAEELRRRGEAYATPQSQRGKFLLDPAETYRVPKYVDLPSHTVDLLTPAKSRPDLP